MVKHQGREGWVREREWKREENDSRTDREVGEWRLSGIGWWEIRWFAHHWPSPTYDGFNIKKVGYHDWSLVVYDIFSDQSLPAKNNFISPIRLWFLKKLQRHEGMMVILAACGQPLSVIDADCSWPDCLSLSPQCLQKTKPYHSKQLEIFRQPTQQVIR